MRKLHYLIPALLIIALTIGCNSKSDSESDSKSTEKSENNTEQSENKSEEKNSEEQNSEKQSNNAADNATPEKSMDITKNSIEFDAFSYLSKFKIGTSNDIFIKYDKGITEVIDKKRSELAGSNPFSADEGPAMNDIYAIKTKFDKNSVQTYHIIYSSGPSADPTFYIYPDGDIMMDPYSISGMRLYIPGNGNVYVAGHTNNEFNTRKKYSLGNNGLQEVSQPYYYVGLKTKTNKALTVYADKSKRSVIANIPADYKIEVLIYDKNTRLYLIRTEFGLTGWVQVSTFGQIDIDGLFYAGD